MRIAAGWRFARAVLVILLPLGAVACGPSAEQAQQAEIQAQKASQAAQRAEVAANKAREAAEQAQIAAENARKAGDDATREINRVADHIEQINRERAGE
jgi:sensor c-di-GMP phosphodiesterase-like protein